MIKYSFCQSLYQLSCNINAHTAILYLARGIVILLFFKTMYMYSISVSILICTPANIPFQTEYPRFESGRFVYRIHRSPMCEYMINFIHKLKHLPEKYMMNSVLENFTILQVSGNLMLLWRGDICAVTITHLQKV